MAWLNPLFFVGALALAVPVLIHLVRREKSEIIQFSSLMFLLRVPKRAIRQQRLKNLLLMLLRLTILALLVLAFARPYLTGDSSAATDTGAGQGVVFMLDNSFSMQYGNNFQRMKSEAVNRIDQLRPGDRAGILSFNDKAVVLAAPTNDTDALKAAISALQPESAGTSYYEAFLLAERMLAEFAQQGRRIVLISDFQRKGWKRSSRESVIPQNVEVEAVDIGVDNSTNVGVESVAFAPATFSRTYTDRIIARVANYRADQPVTVPVVLSLSDREAARKSLTIGPKASAVAEFTGFDLALGFTRASVRIEVEDPLKPDNEFLFALQRKDKLRVLIVNNGRPRQSYFLLQAYTSVADLPFDVKAVAVPALQVSDLQNYEVIIVDDVPRLPDNARDQMSQLRKAGQGQMVILGEASDVGWWNAFPGMPLGLQRKIFAGKDRGRPALSLTFQDRNHPVFAPFEKSAKLTLNTAQFFAYVESDARDGAAVLAKYEDGEPAMAESPRTDPGLLVVTSSMDNRWNDLPLKPSFVPMLHEIVRYLAHYTEARGAYQLGEAVPVTGGLQRAAAAVIDPDGNRLSLGDLEAGQQKYFSPARTGFHEVRIERDSRLVAVNPPSGEGNLEKMPPEDLIASVRRTQGETLRAGGSPGEDRDAYARKQTGWWYLLVLALIAALAEIYVANRSYGRTGGTA